MTQWFSTRYILCEDESGSLARPDSCKDRLSAGPAFSRGSPLLGAIILLELVDWTFERSRRVHVCPGL